MLTINYLVHNERVDFDTTAVGVDFAPSTMVAGLTATLPVKVTNRSSGFSFYRCVAGDTDCWKVGYRWFNSKGKQVVIAGFTSYGTADFAANIASGDTSGTVALPVNPPPRSGQFTLRLDLVHVVNGGYGWASDAADPSGYYDNVKDPLSQPSSVRWVGSSKIARSEFPVSVVSGGGTGIGETKTVSLADGSTVGINVWSRNLHFAGSGGVGFTDLGGGIGLEYYYDSQNAQGTSIDCSGVLGACGWGTNFDEGFSAGSSGADYVYRDAQGNRYAADENSSGQLISGAPARLERYRATVFDENQLAGWTGTGPTLSAPAGNFSGLKSLSISSLNSAGTSTTSFHPIDVSHYLSLSFAVKSTSTGAAIGFHVKNETKGTDGWLFYTVGNDFPIGGHPTVNIPGSVASWKAVTLQNFLADLAAKGLGLSSDRFTLDTILLRGNGFTGTNWYDALRFEGRQSSIFDDVSGGTPPWSANSGNATAFTADKVSGANSIRVAPVTVALSPKCCSPVLAGTLDAYSYLRWSWKKVGGSVIAHAVTLKDLRSNVSDTITYYAGPTPPTGALHPVQIATAAPKDWTTVTRNIAEDGRQILHFYNDHDTSGSETAPSLPPTPDPIQITGYSLIAFDGTYALFDNEDMLSLPYLGEQYGATTGDEFVATFRGGEQHRFDREGRLVGIEDESNNRTNLTWNYDAAGLAETLSLIKAPSDNLPLSSGLAERNILVASSANAVRFTEQLGSTTSASGRYTEFNRTAAGGDLTSVVPARRSAACVAGATGCLTFSYTGSHLLTQIGDPRNTTGGSLATTVTWTSSDPMSIAQLNGADQLKIVSWDTDTGWRLRPQYKDANGVATGTFGYIRSDDLSPNGSVMSEYAPVACSSGTVCPTPPGDLLVSYTTDGADHYSTETHYRLPSSGGPVTSRRGTLAGAKVDNYSDPLVAGLTAWTQTADQFVASVAAGNSDLYRTTYAYNTLGQQTHAITPITNPAGGTVTQDSVTVYDASGRPIQQSDNAFVVNPGFEAALTSWTAAGTATSDLTTSNSGSRSAKLTGASTLYQVISLPPGQTFRLQFATMRTTGSARIKVEYTDTLAVLKPIAGASWAIPSLTWVSSAFDVTVPLDAAGPVRITLQTLAGETGYFDDVAAFTDFGAKTYGSYGLPDTRTDAFGHVSDIDYLPGSAHPGIFPTSVTANEVAGGTAPDENATSTTTYDAWGRAREEVDADGVKTTTTFAANMTDVATIALGSNPPSTNANFDAIGQVLSSTDPLGRLTQTSYTYFGDPVDTTDPGSVVTHRSYDGVGRIIDTYQNWKNGGTGVAGVDNVRETRTLDPFGNVTRVVADAGGGLLTSDAITDSTYDQLGQVVTSTVYPNGLPAGRLTENHFDAAGVATAVRGPINPTDTNVQLCPDSASLRCNTVVTRDLNGRTIRSKDAYNVASTTWYDLAGHPVRINANDVPGQPGTSAQNVITSTVYDLDDRVIGLTDPRGYQTVTTYDDLGRIIKVKRADGTWIRTDWTKAGRQDLVSRPGPAGPGGIDDDNAAAWTKNVYDDAGRLVTTLANYDRSGNAQTQVTEFETKTPEGFDSSPGGILITTGSTATANVSTPHTGGAALEVAATSTTPNQGGEIDLSGTFVQSHTYAVRLWMKGTNSTSNFGVYLGHPANGDYESQALTSTNAWQQSAVLTWVPDVTYSSGVVLAFRVNRDQSVANTATIDDVVVWDTASPERNTPSTTVFDAAGQVIASI